MKQSIASAVFDSRAEAERAVSELRSAGVRDSDISIVAQDHGKNVSTDGAGEKTGDFVSKAALGAGAGALLGVAALAIRVSGRSSRLEPLRRARSAARP
jgi:hypothetical protein